MEWGPDILAALMSDLTLSVKIAGCANADKSYFVDLEGLHSPA